MPHFIALLLLLACAPALAGDVALVGVIGNKAAVLAIDGGDPKTVKLGHTWKGVRVLAVERDRATVEIEGERRVLRRGQHYRAAAAVSSRETTTLSADSRGHFFTDGMVNGAQVRFLVDTGATMVVLPGPAASRMRIDYQKGERGLVQTANGEASAYRVKLDRVKVGAIELVNVDAVVIEQDLDTALLGMSFLNRVEMKRDGPTMTLIRRF